MNILETREVIAPGATEQPGLPKLVIPLLKIVGVLALLIFAVLFPIQISPDDATNKIAIFTVMFAAAATAWNIFAGYTGYIALGHAVFFGTGAYALAIMCQDWQIGQHDISFLSLDIQAGYAPFLLLPLAGLVASIIAVPLGLIALRTRRHTFIVITIAFFFVFQLLAENNIANLTNGQTGLNFPDPTQTSSWYLPFFNYPFYYAMLVILILALAVSWWVRHSKYGLGLLAIRDDEDRALGLGVKTELSKLTAFMISAFFVGMVGGVWGYSQGSIKPPAAFDALFDVSVALMAFLGGVGTLAGPVVGALILEPTKLEFTLYFSDNGYYLIIYGALFLAIMLLLPEGVVPTLRSSGGSLVLRPSPGAFTDKMGEATWRSLWKRLFGFVGCILGILLLTIGATASTSGVLGKVTGFGFFVYLVGGSMAVCVIVSGSFFVGSGLIYLSALLFGKGGSYLKHTYVIASFQFPLVVLALLLGPILGLLGLPALVSQIVSILLAIYGVVLLVLALRAVHQLSTLRATLAAILPSVVIAGIFILILSATTGSL